MRATQPPMFLNSFLENQINFEKIKEEETKYLMILIL